ncbi:MAG: hypothetical protein U0R19_06750 [Bryobacteraceae bacterium]
MPITQKLDICRIVQESVTGRHHLPACANPPNETRRHPTNGILIAEDHPVVRKGLRMATKRMPRS